MPQQISAHTSSHCRHHSGFVAQDNGIGELFRQHGEAYIKAYKPSITAIKLIRSIRICKTPALGGKLYTCTACQQKKYIYFGCGNSRCPLCQGIKRLQWQDKLANKILRCPYQHITFTMPHLLNNIARRNPTVIYNILMRAAWKTIKICSQEPSNLGATPGGVFVLHTFGADLKYHVHVHALVTFGGISKKGDWLWPKRKNKIVPFRQMRRTFRSCFIAALQKVYPQLHTLLSFDILYQQLMQKAWCVHAEPPTNNTKVIQEYLGRYICRIGLSIKKFNFDQAHQQVTLSFKDYRNKHTDGTIPQGTISMKPLIAIHQIIQHTLPPYFQKCRYYGLHASATYKKYKKLIPKVINNNNTTVRTVIQIVSAMMGIDLFACQHCQNTQFDVEIIKADRRWILQWINLPHNKGSPYPRNPISSLQKASKHFEQGHSHAYCQRNPIK